VKDVLDKARTPKGHAARKRRRTAKGALKRGRAKRELSGAVARSASERDTVHASVYAAMKQALMRGVYVPGQKITIRSVAASLGTSATPVREAIRRLAAEGALEHIRGRARLPTLDRPRLAEITEVRVVLESLAARHAAVKMQSQHIKALESIQADLTRARNRKDYDMYLAKNEEFHFSYYRISAMPNLLRAIESMWLQAGPYLKLLLPSMRGIDLHAAAINAGRRHDGDAAAAAIEEDIRRAAVRLATLIPDAELS
jgi:DNA-binding GntR family transcriptional regulator